MTGKDFLILIVGFLLGILSIIIRNLIGDSRKKKSVKIAITDELQTNFNQLRDGIKYSIERKQGLPEGEPLIRKDGLKSSNRQTIVIYAYKFRSTAYESSISDIHLIRSASSMEVHKFYARLKALEDVAETANRLFQEAQAVEPLKPKHSDVKNLDGDKVDGYFHHTMNDYELFERQAYELGVNVLKKLTGKEQGV